MCEQTEINYLDGDIVWVKLGACWWPGQVTGFHNLPKDIQDEFQKKPLIAAVKFFQEDTYEFVKNYQQIYKYNCTQKDEFIRKGLDKYRSKSKDGSRYMDKFPGDVEMAEKLTGGDPDILNRDKFCPEEKPNISALFGDKKVTKKKKEREETSRRSDNTMEIARKITHPRFLRESDHEVRIRQQPSSLPSTPNNTGSPQYPCHLCNFTSSRVNVIICHIKSHRSGSSPVSKTKVSTYSQYRGSRHSDLDTPKRKYVRKEKSQSSRSKSSGESGKRKQMKQNEKTAKKKKMDPKIRDTILADWEDESDEDVNPNQSKQSDSTPVNSSPTRSHFDFDKSEEPDRKNNTLPDPNEIIAETDKLLKETEKLTSINIMEHSEITDNTNTSKSFKSNLFDKQSDRENERTVDVEMNECADRSQKEKESSNSDNESKYNTVNKDDRKSLLSCFDFHEEELSIPPVRKKARAFHQKKEIIKEFEMSQALKTEQEKEAEKKSADEDNNIKSREIENEKMAELMSLGVKDLEKYGKCKKLVEEDDDKPMNNEAKKVSEEFKSEKMSADVQKFDTGDRNTELEAVEIFEAGKSEEESSKTVTTFLKIETQQVPKTNTEVELSEDKEFSVQSEGTSSVDKPTEYKRIDIDNENTRSTEQQPSKEIDEISSERFTTETEDETVSESADTLPDQSETEDADMPDQDQRTNLNLAKTLSRNDQLNVNVTPRARKRRGRPKKSDFLQGSTGGNASGSESPSIKDNKISQKLLERFEIERRTSESDSERSYSGRKRKPNKKYLESDIYVQDLDRRIYETDESQSENEEKSSEKVKGRTKRNKKFSTSEKETSEKIEFEVEKELEISCNVSNVAENNLNCSDIELQGNITESNTRQDEVVTEVDTKNSDDQPSNEVYENMTIPLEENDSQKCASALSEDTKSREVESVAETKDALLESEKVEDVAMETENLSSSNDVRTENLKNPNIESCLEPNPIQPEISTEKEEKISPPQTDILKTVEMLPPKKSQIKKFELSQIDFFDSGTSVNKSTIEPELVSGEEKLKQLKHEEAFENDANSDKTTHALKGKEDIFFEKLDSDTKSEDTTKEESSKEETKTQRIEEALPTNDEVHRTEMGTSDVQKQELKLDSSEQIPKDAANEQQQPHKKSSMQTRYKGKFTPETGAKSKKDKELSIEEEKSANTFQEAFLKTLHIDKKKGGADDSDTASKGKKGKKSTKKKSDEDADAASTSAETVQDAKANEESSKKAETLHSVRTEENESQLMVVSNFEGIEVVVDQNLEIDAKANDTVFQHVDQFASSPPSSNEPDSASKSLGKMRSPSIEDASKSISVDIQKIDVASRMSTSTPSTSPSPSSDVAVPVKKREMPRIIKNVTLTEPMQILKSKLLDKFPQKGTKHKLEAETPKRSDQKGGPKAKVMKIECLASNAKMKTGSKVTSHMSLTKKLQVLKAEEAETAAMMEAQNEQLNLKTSKASTATAATEKFIQQSSQSLADMELDINSMPFVLSEDVLTPENIEQMPVVISSIIPASSTIPATLSFTPTTQIVSHTQTQYKLSENTTEASPMKKKSGTPAILKNKSKAKPTITSIKTIVPPLTGGVKGIKFQSAPATSKVPPLLTQKSTPGKYVVVQTSAGQQIRYSVQGKPSTQQKIAIPTGKPAGNTQVVQQGGKVVILTSAQSGQTKMLPLNIAKTLGNKVQRIMTSKGQVLCPISPQGIINSKTVIAPKGDGASPTTSKLPAGHKIINTQGIITSKGVLTPISGTIGKTALLGTLSQGILTKGGIYTPISASTLGGKTIIGSKTLVTKGAATILSSQNLGTSKAILTPISQAISGKTILSPQGIASKATVLTPITGQQVKAIAAKSPSKAGKVQYQSVQQKVQLPMLQKSQKVATSSSQGRSGQSKSAANTVVLQNTVSAQKTTGQGKRIIKQTMVQQGSPIQNITTQSGSQQTISMSSQVQKGKAVPTSAVQKVILPRGGRQSKTQQKIVVQKVQEPAITAVQNIQAKQTVSGSLVNLPGMSKIAQQKHPVTPTKSGIKSHHAIGKSPQQRKNLFNVTMNSAAGASSVSTNLSTSLSLPPLEPIEPEKKMKVESVLSETVRKEAKGDKFGTEKGGEASEKVEGSKIPTQPQIMALPTESSDGTQTYVLVTIDEQGQIHPLDNNALMSLEGTTQNPDGTRTLYIDPSSLGEAGTLDNIVLQFDNGVLPTNIQSSSTEPTQTIVSESFPTSEVMHTSNQDILAAALANTDFQQEINLSENPAGNVVMTTGLTQTSLINQTILQSTIIPPTEPISSPSVLETSLTLNQPIMTPLEVPSNLPIQSETPSVSAVTTIPSSLELPITITNPSISYISTGEAQIQIPGNSMPDIGEIMESSSPAEIAEIPRTDVPTVTTQYLALPTLESNIPAESRIERTDAATMPSVSYSVSVPNSIVIETSQAQTTPSMPIIDDTYTENVQFGSTVTEQPITTEQTFADVAVSEMLVSKPPASTESVQSQDVTVTSEMNISQRVKVSTSSQETIVSTNEPITLEEEQNTEAPLEKLYTSQQVPMHSEEMILQPSNDKEENGSSNATMMVDRNEETVHVVDISDQPDVTDEIASITSESSVKISLTERTSFEAKDSNEIDVGVSQQSENVKKLEELTFADKVDSPVAPEQPLTSNKAKIAQATAEILPAESLNRLDEHSMNMEVDVEVEVDVDEDVDVDIDETMESKSYAASSANSPKESERCQRDEPSSQAGELKGVVSRNLDLQFEETNSETSHETPSQSYEQFGGATTDSTDLPSQSATKSENSREPSQSITYEPMETDEETIVTEPPSQSFEHLKMNEASQSYETSAEESTNAPTQSFNELMQCQEERTTMDEGIDDQTFPTQSYDVGKAENISENLETDTEISQEGNMPSQSNDIGADGIGTSSVSTNNSGLNEDETASSSYVPETPENQERDPDQESAISTSSCEIPPCADLNIASSSAEHTIIHDNGVPEIPTSSYNLNPDITSTHVDSVPSSSYEEQNVSTSYEVPISMPGLEETPSQNFVTESTDHRNEPSSYYAHHQEVTASYYEPVGQETNSRLDEDPQEEVTPSYYEGNPQEASQSYFNPEEATPSYSSHNVSPSYYDHRPESEASQSYYSTDDIEKSERSTSQNIEASPSFYQEQSDELKLRQQGEATPTYTERYPVDYTLENSPIERHDLVESSVPATRPAER